MRERLCELELPWILRSFGKEQLADWGPPTRRFTLKPWTPKPGGRREQMLEATGRAQVPYLIDANHDIRLFESVAPQDDPLPQLGDIACRAVGE